MTALHHSFTKSDIRILSTAIKFPARNFEVNIKPPADRLPRSKADRCVYEMFDYYSCNSIYICQGHNKTIASFTYQLFQKIIYNQ